MRRGRAKYEEFLALRSVSLEVSEGATYGLIGGNGSGKSTLLKCMAKIYRPDSGTITTRGKVAALLELGSGFQKQTLQAGVHGVFDQHLVTRPQQDAADQIERLLAAIGRCL